MIFKRLLEFIESWGNPSAIAALESSVLDPGKFRGIHRDLGDKV